MKANEEERLTLVTDFESLRVGDLVVVKPCPLLSCAGAHRAMLLRYESATVHSYDMAPRVEMSYELHPQPSCNRGPGPRVVTARMVAERRLFKVETGLRREQAESESRPTRRPRAVRA